MNFWCLWDGHRQRQGVLSVRYIFFTCKVVYRMFRKLFSNDFVHKFLYIQLVSGFRVGTGKKEMIIICFFDYEKPSKIIMEGYN